MLAVMSRVAEWKGFVSATVSTVLIGCTTATSRTSLTEAVPLTTDSSRALDCGTGVASYFGLEPIEELPMPAALGIPPSQFQPGIPYSWEKPSNATNIRLDLCIDTQNDGQTNAHLKRVVLKNVNSYTSVLSVPIASRVEGLSSAIFGEVSPNLSVIVPFESIKFSTDSPGSPVSDTFVMRPLPDKSGVFVFVGTKINNVFVPAVSRLMAGRLVPYDAIGLSRCPLDQQEENFSFSLPNVTFRGIMCVRSLTTGTRGYTIVVLAGKLPNGSELFNLQTQDAVSGMHSTKINHHNGCDSAVIKSGTRTYAVTAAAAFGNDCGGILSEAPARTDGDPRKVKFVIRDAGNEIASGFLECSHQFLSSTGGC